MRRPDPGRPGRTYESGVAALWPQLGDEEPHQYDLDRTYGRLVTGRRLNLDTGEWEAVPRTTTRPLLRIVCSAEHDKGASPMLAEVWHTDLGLFFASRLPGAAFDPPDHPTEPFAAPTAVLPSRLKNERRALAGRPRRGRGWAPIPITVVRLFLEEPTTQDATLWVKCADHGPGIVDRTRLYRAYLADKEGRRSRDTPHPTVIGLHDVEALFCT